MKPADRALDIVAIGLGQGGGNIAAEFSRLGYRAMALNTAHTDLSALTPGSSETALSREQCVYIGLDGYDGAGADLNYGRECIRENAGRIREAVRAHAAGADVVMLTAGLGGGTGSAVSELVDVLEDLELPIVALTTLPGEHESGIAKVNAARGLSELVKRRTYGWIFADNQRLAQSHGSVSLDRYFEAINQVIVAPLDALNRLNDREGVHPLRTLDGEDFRRLLLSSGVLNYAETVLPELSVDAVTHGIRQALLSSGVMPAGFSLEEVAYMGVVLEAPASTLSDTPFSFFEHLSEQLKNDTGGGAIYLGMYRTPNVEGGAARLRLIGSSQSLPSGIQAVVNDAKREGSTLRDKLRRAVDALDLGDIEDFDLFKTHARTAPTRRRGHELNLEHDPLTEYLSATRTTPAPAPLSEAPSLGDSSIQALLAAGPDAGFGGGRGTLVGETWAQEPNTAASDDSATLDTPRTMPASGPIQRGSSDSDTYTKLADAFLASTSDATRRRIARRLDVAQNSESAVIREHASHAIERIRQVDPSAYDHALSLEPEQQVAKG
jgi:cell division GTPase FtsZ